MPFYNRFMSNHQSNHSLSDDLRGDIVFNEEELKNCKTFEMFESLLKDKLKQVEYTLKQIYKTFYKTGNHVS